MPDGKKPSPVTISVCWVNTSCCIIYCFLEKKLFAVFADDKQHEKRFGEGSANKSWDVFHPEIYLQKHFFPEKTISEFAFPSHPNKNHCRLFLRLALLSKYCLYSYAAVAKMEGNESDCRLMLMDGRKTIVTSRLLVNSRCSRVSKSQINCCKRHCLRLCDGLINYRKINSLRTQGNYN